MNNVNFSVFLPLRGGSQRVINKNTRSFTANDLSLFQLKMTQLQGIIDLVHEIIISTDDEKVILQASPFLIHPKIKVIKRPTELCLSTTKVQDLINYVPTVTESEHIFWLHVTSPFVNTDDYKIAIQNYIDHIINGSNDSLMSVNKISQFIWDDKKRKIINCDRSINPWPNTQDLDPLYEINHAFYISSRKNYFHYMDRIGINPFLMVLEGEKKIDIDWQEDFDLARKIMGS